MENKKIGKKYLKDQLNVTNILWLSLFFVTSIFQNDVISNILNYFNKYFHQPWSSVVGLIILSIWFFRSPFNLKCLIVKWSAPLVFWALPGIKQNGLWQINVAIILFLAFYIIFLLTILIHLGLVKFGRRKKDDINQGLISDDPIESSEENDSFGRRDYARSIVSEIRKTVNKRAFNIAVTGAWGSGKTSFLNLIKGEMDKEVDDVKIENYEKVKFITVKYNPWDFKEDKIIGLDLLKTINHELANEKELQEKFKGLMVSLQGMNQSPWYKVIPYFLSGFPKEKSINEYRQEIGKALHNQNKKLIIFLDDLDRLDGDEILEVFKTIRNSFDIANTFFILGFDIEYVADQIKKKVKGGRALEYLEKIFQMRLPMPSIFDYSYYKEYKKLVKSNFNIDLDVDNDLTFRINSMRKLYQLINSLKVFLNKENLMDYNFEALVNIESLKIMDPKLYNFIIENPEGALSKYNSIGSSSVYTDGRGANKNTYESFMKELAKISNNQYSTLLDDFFRALDNKQGYRIKREEFFKYFKYSLLQEEFSSALLNTIITEKNKAILYDNLTDKNRDSLYNKIDDFLNSENKSNKDWLLDSFIELLYKDHKYLWLHGKKYNLNKYSTYASFDDMKQRISELKLKDKIVFLTELEDKDVEVEKYLIEVFSKYFTGTIDDYYWLVYHSLKENDREIKEELKQEFIKITRDAISNSYLEIFKSAVSISPEGGSRTTINHSDPSNYYLVGLFSSQDWINLFPIGKNAVAPYSDIRQWLENLNSNNYGLLNYTQVFGKDFFDRNRGNKESKLEEE